MNRRSFLAALAALFLPWKPKPISVDLGVGKAMTWASQEGICRWRGRLVLVPARGDKVYYRGPDDPKWLECL